MADILIGLLIAIFIVFVVVSLVLLIMLLSLTRKINRVVEGTEAAMAKVSHNAGSARRSASQAILIGKLLWRVRRFSNKRKEKQHGKRE